jgi:tetratricopeptide (TPR) repeat protein
VDGVFLLVDSLTRELIAGLNRSPGQRLDRLAATTTRSLPALKAFLEGESHYRHTRFSEAVDAFQRATVLDTTFALAYYRLSAAADFMSRSDVAQKAADQAARFGERLTPRDAALLEARRLWWRAANDEAERLCRQVLDGHPEDIEAWNLLGEILFHANPLRGRSSAESRPAFERVLSARPDDKEAVDHLVRIAAYERRREEVLRLARKQFRMGVFPEDPRDSMTAWRMHSLEDSVYYHRVLSTRRSHDFGGIHATTNRMATNWGNFQAAAQFEALLTQPAQAPWVRAFGHITLAELELARGRWHAVQPHLASAAPLDRLHTVEYSGLLSATLYLTPNREELASRRRDLESLDISSPPPSPIEQLQPFDSAHAVVRRFLIGLVSARLGDTATARESAVYLEREPAESASTRKLARALAHSLRALIAWQTGDARATLTELEDSKLETSQWMLAMPFGSRSWERYLRGEALHALGRDDEALGWYESMGQNWTYDLIYLAPALAQAGAILERKARLTEAAHRYARAVDLWKDADPELRPLIEAAKTRLAVLCDIRVDCSHRESW